MVGVCRPKADFSIPRRIVEEGLVDSISVEYSNISDYQSIARVIAEYSPDIIVHLAAQSHVGLSFNQPISTARTNVDGTLNILEALRLHVPDASFVFAGTSEEYGLVIVSEEQYARLKEQYNIVPSPVEIPELPISEDNPLRPRSPYAVSKVFGDMLTRNYADAYDMNAKVIRGFNFEGPGRGVRFVTSTVVIQVIDVVNGEAINIRLGNVNAFRDWTHVADMAEAYFTYAIKGEPGDVINFGSMRTNSVLTFVLLSFAELGWMPTRLQTQDGQIVINDPLDSGEQSWFGVDFWHTRVDDFILGGGEFTPDHGDIIVEFENGRSVRVHIDTKLFRPAEVPILLANNMKARRKYGVTPTRSLRDIVRDMIAYYSDPMVRGSIVH